MAESTAVLRTFHYSMRIDSTSHSAAARRGVVSMHNAKWLTSTKSLISAFGRELVSSRSKRAGILVSCVKTSDGAVFDGSNGSPEKTSRRGATFPSGFEELVLGVCDTTQVAELKMKIGDFEMHLKRNIKSVEAHVPVASPTEPPPIPSKPMTESAPADEPSFSGKPKTNPFTNATVKKSRKLAALEASGATGYVLVSCPTVGSFHKSRTLKGKKQPPACKEGDAIREGQIICYLDQFGTELPVKSDVAGEVIKILFDDGGTISGSINLAHTVTFH
ncbi:Biotin/lipoyl attachment, partial [Cynara cardunculus var. scolymus]